MTVRILQGDCREILGSLPDESVHCVVTSPPYWGLRDYGVAGQLGLEPTLGEHIAVMVEVLREVRRVMRKDATLWLNYGDCYATSPNGRSAADTKAAGNDDRTFRDKPFSTVGAIQARSNGGEGQHLSRVGGFLKPKDLCMVPNRLAIALQDDGWWVRSEIIWHKPNPMPESIKDRPGTSHEKVWLLTKSERYFYNAEAVAEAAKYVGVAGQDANGFKNPLRFDGKMAEAKKQDGHGRRHAGFNERWDAAEERGDCSETRNLRNVWTIPTAPFAEAHFATFPPALVEPCIKAGCPMSGTVLDPFGGSGTVGLVADRLGCNAILIELNPEYAAIAERRLRADGGMFIDIATDDGYDPAANSRGCYATAIEALRRKRDGGADD